MTNGFALNHAKPLQLYFFCIKHQAKTYFLKNAKAIGGRHVQGYFWLKWPKSRHRFDRHCIRGPARTGLFLAKMAKK